jgi:fatty-acyl-CoA synthase
MSGFTLSNVFRTVASAVPDRDFLVHRDDRRTYADADARIDGFASFLLARGHGCHIERDRLAGHESGQDHVGLYLRNGAAYVEAMLGACRARAAAFNVNYRYVREELTYLLTDADTKVLVFHAEFAPMVAEIREAFPSLLLVQVGDESGNALLPGAVDFEEALRTPIPSEGLPQDTEDDLYILYTGGTTGMPKGVLWRQDDIYVTSMGGTPFGSNEPLASYEALREHAASGAAAMRLVQPLPFMHGSAQWSVFHAITGGGTVVLPHDVRHYDAADVLRTAIREGCMSLPVVGDAVARPLIDEIERGGHDLSGIAVIGNGGAPLTPTIKSRLLELMPHVIIMDALGSSETGMQMRSMSTVGSSDEAAIFTPEPTTTVLDDTRSRVLGPGDGEGWLAQRGRVPLGYLGDAEKTQATFPVIDGVRWSAPGDRARLLEDGRIELFGREGITINSGGEKIFVEEVERALIAHPAVRDVLVVGRPSDRWGSEPVAIVQIADDVEVDDEDLLTECRRHVAGYKVPREIIRVPQVVRSPAGKADYRWAKTQAVEPRADSTIG